MIFGLDGEKTLSNKVQVLKNKSADKTGPGVGLMSLTQTKKKRKKKVSLEFGLMLDKTITNLKTGFKLTVVFQVFVDYRITFRPLTGRCQKCQIYV